MDHQSRGYKRIGFWTILVILIAVILAILLIPRVLPAIIFEVNVVSNNNLLLQVIGFVYGYICLVFCFKKKWFMAPESMLKILVKDVL